MSTALPAARPTERASIPHPPQWPQYDAETIARTTELVSRGRTFDYGYGAEIEELEAILARRHGRKYCLAVNSGSSALLCAYYGLGIGPGDEVILPTFTFVTGATSLLLLGATPVLADSGDPFGNITAATVEPLITKHTRAICVTHLHGVPARLDELRRLAANHGLALIEDCSHAHRSRFADGASVGTNSEVAVYSLGGLKPVSGGMAGALLTDDEDVYDLGCLLSSFKTRSRLTIRRPELRPLADTGLGGNLRISPIASVLAMSHLRRLDGIVTAKQANVARLVDGLCRLPGLRRATPTDGSDPGGQYGVHVRVDPAVAPFTRDDLVEALRAKGCLVSAPTTRLIHRTALFRGVHPPRRTLPLDRHGDTPAATGVMPGAESLHDSLLALPDTYLHGDRAELVDSYLAAFARLWAGCTR